MPEFAQPLLIVFAAIGGGFGVYATAIALGFRHGIDWDHIAAITDITSAGASTDERESWLLGEPGVQITDESHHLAHEHADVLDDHEHAHVHGQPHEHAHHVAMSATSGSNGSGGGVALAERPPSDTGLH